MIEIILIALVLTVMFFSWRKPPTGLGVIGLLLILSLSSCSASKRVARILKNNPELVKRDTSIVYDTVRLEIPGFKFDTVTTLNSMTKDTFIVRERDVLVKTIYNNTTDSVYVFVERDPMKKDTIVEKQVIVNSVEVDEFVKWKAILWIVGILILLILLVYLVYRIAKKFI